MAAQTGVLLFLTFLQMCGAVTLFVHAGGRFANRILAGLLLLNGGLSGLAAFAAEGYSTPFLRAFEYALDAPTALLLFAFVLTRSESGWGHRVAPLLILGSVGYVLAFIPAGLPPSGEVDAAARGVPYFVALAATVFVTAASPEPWQRWVALAFLPRVAYFGTQGLFSYAPGPWDVLSLPYVLNAAGYVALGPVAVVAAVLLLRGTGGPRARVIVPMLAVGPGIALVEHLSAGHNLLLLVLNFLTLSLVRPILLYRALVPEHLGSILLRSLGAAGAGTSALLFALWGLGLPPGPAVLLALVTGTFLYAVLEAVGPEGRADRGAAPAEAAPRPPPLVRAEPAVDASPVAVPVEIPFAPQGMKPAGGMEAVEVAAEPGSLTPQWQRILVVLRGSHEPEGDPVDPRPEWTQKELARLTGISVKRVSEFPRTMNASSVAKLDQYLPDWREGRSGGGGPVLVQTFKGMVPGMPGVWVYYRLTPLGDRLAEAVAAESSLKSAQEAPDSAPAADRNPESR